MMSQYTMWLYPLLVLSVISLFVRLRLPFNWGWGFILQALPVLACGLAGLFVGPDWLFALIGWILVFAFYLPARFFYAGIQKNLTDLNPAGMKELSRRVKYIFWGVPGEFWSDMCNALALYMEGDGEKAEGLLKPWEGKLSTLPNQTRSVPSSYRLVGNAVMSRWTEIIADYERFPEDTRAHLGGSVLLSTARAFVEQGRVDEAADCIRNARLDEASLPLSYLSLSLLPFFALTGSRAHAETLLAILGKGKDFKEANRLHWLGRCLWVEGEVAQAREALERARDLTGSDVLAQRISRHLERLNSGERPELAGNDIEKSVEDVWSVFKKAAYVQELISPQRRSLAVFGLIVLIVTGYVLQGMPFLGPLTDQMVAGNPCYRILATTVRNGFVLFPELVLKGEYYRLLTYLFLHGHVTHMLLNIIGLFWFGKLAENIFGTSRFLAIYIVGGVMSGMAHTLLAPSLPAWGASGGVMAVFGASAAGIYRLKDQIPASIWKFQMSWLGGLALFQIILDQIIPNVAVFAHLGGLIAGVAFGMLLSVRKASSDGDEITGRFVGG